MALIPTDPVTNTELDKIFDLPVIDGLVAAGQNIWDFLFGSGHAGSCGMFRDQYFSVKNNLDPIMDAAVTAYTQAAQTNNARPTQVMNKAGQYVLPAIDGADKQFDQYKGHNLLGQTMFGSRLHLYIFKRWAGILMFGNQQWNEYRIGELFTSLGNAWNNLKDHSKALEWHQSEIVALQKLTPRVQTLETAMSSTKTLVDTIRNVDIPAIQKSVAGINTFVNGTLSPLVTKHSADIGQLLTNTIPGITAQITSLDGSIKDIRATYATKAELASLGKQLSDCCAASQAKITVLQGQMADAVKRLGGDDTAILALQQAVAGLKQKDAQIDGTLAGLQQQISSLQQAIPTLATKQELAALQARAAALEAATPSYARKTEITALQGQIDKVVADAAGLTKLVDFNALKAQVAAIQQQLPLFAKSADLAALQQRVASVEGQLPTFAKGAEFQALKKVVDSLVSAGIVRDQLLSQHSGQIVALQQRDTALQGQITVTQSRLTTLEGLQSTYAKASDIPLLNGRITQLQQTMGTLASKQQIVDVQSQIDFLVAGNTAIRADIAALKAQQTALQNQLASYATKQQVTLLEEKISALKIADTAQLSLISGLQSQATALQQRLTQLTADVQKLRSDYDLEKSYLDKAIPQLQAVDAKLRSDLDTITTTLQQQTWPELVQHGARIALLEKQKVETVLPAIAKIWQTIQQLDQTIQQTINNPQWFTQNTYQRIYNYFSQPDSTTQQTVNNIVNMIQNTFVTNQQITNTFIQKLMVQISNQYTLNQQVTNQFITNVMQQITNQFVSNQQTTLQYVSQFYQTTNNLYQTNQQVTNYVTQQVTNVLNNLYQTTEINYTTVQKVTHNLFKSYVTNIFNNPPQDLCAAVRKCVTEQKEALCDFGKRAWGKMAECWLDANTPDRSPPTGLAEYPSIVSIAQDFKLALAPQPSGPFVAPGLLAARQFLQILNTGQLALEVIPVQIPLAPDYIFEEAA